MQKSIPVIFVSPISINLTTHAGCNEEQKIRKTRAKEVDDDDDEGERGRTRRRRQDKENKEEEEEDVCSGRSWFIC